MGNTLGFSQLDKERQAPHSRAASEAWQGEHNLPGMDPSPLQVGGLDLEMGQISPSVGSPGSWGVEAQLLESTGRSGMDDGAHGGLIPPSEGPLQTCLGCVRKAVGGVLGRCQQYVTGGECMSPHCERIAVELATERADLCEARTQLQMLQQRILLLERQATEAQTVAGRSEQALRLNAEERDALLAELQAVRKRLESALYDKNVLTLTLGDTNTELQRERTVRVDAQNEAASLRDTLTEERAASGVTVAQLQSELNKALGLVESLTEAHARIDGQLAAALAELDTKTKANAALKTRLTAKEELCADLGQQFHSSRELYLTEKRAREALEATVTGITNESCAKDEVIQACQVQQAELQTAMTSVVKERDENHAALSAERGISTTLREELDALRSGKCAMDVDSAHKDKEIERFKTRATALDDALAAERLEKERLRFEIHDVLARINVKDADVSKLREENVKLDTQVKRLLRERDAATETAGTDLAALQEEIEKRDGFLKNMQDTCLKYGDINESLEAQVKALQDSLKTERAAKEAAEAELAASLNNTRSQGLSLTGDVGDDEFLARIQEMIIDLQQQNDKLKNTNAELAKEKAEIKAVLDDVYLECNQAVQARKELLEENKALKECDLRECFDEMVSYSKTLAAENKELKTQIAELQTQVQQQQPQPPVRRRRQTPQMLQQQAEKPMVNDSRTDADFGVSGSILRSSDGRRQYPYSEWCWAVVELPGTPLEDVEARLMGRYGQTVANTVKQIRESFMRNKYMKHMEARFSCVDDRDPKLRADFDANVADMASKLLRGQRSKIRALEEKDAASRRSGGATQHKQNN